MTHQITIGKMIDSRWGWLNTFGGIVARITGMLLLLGIISLITSVLQLDTMNGWFLLFQNNWLMKIFILHADFNSVHADLLGLNLLDIVILLFVSVICLSLSTAFRGAGKAWSLIAFGWSVIAIILFVITQLAGRSTVMLAVLINSFVMLRAKTFEKVTVYVGILASLFLFVGDLTVGVHSNIITILFGVGYLLLTTWCFLIAPTLVRPDRS
jgi:hypothetical protein